MKTFQITENIKVVCEYKNTRNGFKHTATLYIDGVEQESTKVCYLNRTWESYDYQTVLCKLIRISTSLTPDQKEFCNEYAKKDHTDNSDFKMISAIAKMGDIICNNQKESNDWKTRMIKAGLDSKGLIMPEDWNTLNEDTKEQRLNAVIQQLKGGDSNE